jgi:hypothetical protein
MGGQNQTLSSLHQPGHHHARVDHVTQSVCAGSQHSHVRVHLDLLSIELSFGSLYAYLVSLSSIGAGMGGMGSALALAVEGFKNIHVWESASVLGEVGAGINITPNLSRILQRWGVLDDVTSEAVSLASASVLRECGRAGSYNMMMMACRC